MDYKKRVEELENYLFNSCCCLYSSDNCPLFNKCDCYTKFGCLQCDKQRREYINNIK